MVNKLPHVEDANSTIYLPPKGDYETFADESHYEEKVREWGLSTTKEVKKEFWYKDNTHKRLVTIKGYEVYGTSNEYNTVIIEFQDGNLSCIHPAYLKEMQSSSFAKTVDSDSQTKSSVSREKATEKKPSKKTTSQQNTEEKKEKPKKLILPEEKVHFTAAVKQFALTWNNFKEENEEVVVLENVVIDQENPIEVGLAWCSHSKTLKKFELVPGETLEFDGKIVKKKLPKGKDVDEEFVLDATVSYKINNPSKINKG